MSLPTDRSTSSTAAEHVSDHYALAVQYNTPKLVIRRVATQTLALETATPINWDTQDTDSAGLFTPTSTNIVIPASLGGVWAHTLIWESEAIDATRMYVNPVSASLGSDIAIPVAGSAATTFGATWILPLIDGDSLTIGIYQGWDAIDLLSAKLYMYRIGS